MSGKRANLKSVDQRHRVGAHAPPGRLAVRAGGRYRAYHQLHSTTALLRPARATHSGSGDPGAFTATFLILKGVQDASERSVVPASLPIAMAREPLNQPSRFGLTSTPQAL